MVLVLTQGALSREGLGLMSSRNSDFTGPRALRSWFGRIVGPKARQIG